LNHFRARWIVKSSLWLKEQQKQSNRFGHNMKNGKESTSR
jgi:hypothetical protein